MNFVHLVELIVAREQGEKRDYFKHDAAHTPKIHFIAVVAICQQTFWCTVPTCAYVLCVRLL